VPLFRRTRRPPARTASPADDGAAGAPQAPDAPESAAAQPPVPAVPPQLDRPRGPIDALSGHPLLRLGLYAWASIGIGLGLLALLFVVGQVRLIVVPLVLALFPAALLAPVQKALLRLRLPPAVAALIVVLGGIGLLVGVGLILVPQVADEVPRLTAQVQAGLNDLQAYLDEGPFGIDPQAIRDGIEGIQEGIAESDILRTGVLGAAGAVAEITTMLLLMLVVLFFYLKDGTRIAEWGRSLFPRTVQHDVHEIGTLGWVTIGSYFRGQIFVALVDGVFIGIGIALLGVPLALPLGVLVFFASLFPIVGAVVSGALAVLVALASGGPGVALMALLIVIGVQQIESNLLAPLVLGKATALHPLAVITSLTAGGILLGVLGAFIAVPIAASIARSVGYLRQRRMATTPATDLA
jgi:putative heme transporter